MEYTHHDTSEPGEIMMVSGKEKRNGIYTTLHVRAGRNYDGFREGEVKWNIHNTTCQSWAKL